MGMFITFLVVAALASFVFYNMDQMNKLSADVRFIKNILLDKEPNISQEATQKSL